MAAQSSLRKFSEWAWPIVEPGHAFVPGRHIDCVTEHLEAVSRQEIPDLVINMPPGHMKSYLTSVFFPAWVWTFDPASRWVTSSYAQNLSVRDALRMRRLVESEQYQSCWPLRLLGDQNAKHNFANEKYGQRISTSVDGSNTGEGGNYIIVDDPHNAKEILSDSARQGVTDWWKNVMSSRHRPPRTGGRILVMQRLHDRDLAGLLKEMGWLVLRLPYEFEPGDPCITVKLPSTGDKPWQDWRVKEGELLWPKMYGQVELKKIKRELESQWAIAGQLQQRPSPMGGGIVKWDWWQLWGRAREQRNGEPEKFPPCHLKLMSLDTAFEAHQQADYSACTTWGVFDDGTQTRVMLLHAWRARLEFHELLLKIEEEMKRYKPHQVLIEKKVSGISVRQELQRRLSDAISIQPINPKGDKAARLNATVGLFEHGVIYAPDYDWADMVIDECARFPAGDHDDIVDTVSQALLYLRGTGIRFFPEDADADGDPRLATNRKFY